MKVFVVVQGKWGPQPIMGVYASKEAAEVAHWDQPTTVTEWELAGRVRQTPPVKTKRMTTEDATHD